MNTTDTGLGSGGRVGGEGGASLADRVWVRCVDGVPGEAVA